MWLNVISVKMEHPTVTTIEGDVRQLGIIVGWESLRVNTHLNQGGDTGVRHMRLNLDKDPRTNLTQFSITEPYPRN